MPNLLLKCGLTVQCDPEDVEYIESVNWQPYKTGVGLELSQLTSKSFTNKRGGKKFIRHRFYLFREIAFRQDPRLRAIAGLVMVFARDRDRFNCRRDNIDVKFRRPKAGKTSGFAIRAPGIYTKIDHVNPWGGVPRYIRSFNEMCHTKPKGFWGDRTPSDYDFLEFDEDGYDPFGEKENASRQDAVAE